jgi:hypothetical protein
VDQGGSADTVLTPALYESGSYLTLWLRYLSDTSGTWFGYLGDSGSGIWATLFAE